MSINIQNVDEKNVGIPRGSIVCKNSRNRLIQRKYKISLKSYFVMIETQKNNK